MVGWILEIIERLVTRDILLAVDVTIRISKDQKLRFMWRL